MDKNFKNDEIGATVSANEIIKQGIHQIVNRLKKEEFVRIENIAFKNSELVGTKETNGIELYLESTKFDVNVKLYDNDLDKHRKFLCKNVADFFVSLI